MKKMDLSKINSVILFICIWILLNILLNLFGVLLNILIDRIGIGTEIYNGNFLNKTKNILFQLITFSFITYVSSKLWKKSYHYIFVIILAIIAHIIFFSHLRYDNGYFFIMDVPSFNDDFLYFIGQELTDIVYSFVFCPGILDGGIYMTKNIYLFYIAFILSPLMYHVFLIWLSKKCTFVIGKYYFKKKDSTCNIRNSLSKNE